MTLMTHSKHHCLPFVCFVVVDVMLSNISFALAFTNFQPIFSFTIESEICVSGQTMKRQLWEKMISTDIMQRQMPRCSLYLWLFNLVAKPRWSIMQSCSLLWKQSFDSFFPHKTGADMNQCGIKLALMVLHLPSLHVPWLCLVYWIAVWLV